MTHEKDAEADNFIGKLEFMGTPLNFDGWIYDTKNKVVSSATKGIPNTVEFNLSVKQSEVFLEFARVHLKDLMEKCGIRVNIGKDFIHYINCLIPLSRFKEICTPENLNIEVDNETRWVLRHIEAQIAVWDLLQVINLVSITGIDLRNTNK